ncbi:MAG: 50S ribosomal protein L31 [Candidatus Phytoplasma stylosanthis]|uniref:50S ribosomal protein L31 n=1 Tax=Candidatus Phytoplasma stylosanthis TaxID=2798314 RepID=UPI002939CE9D|nr:50S ribosomal protein L31 [Candidatus Phytoplasma stylosanthis]MDV3167984.1 50S ribosomal protein L31 [Candidatus Phytoplasma stylosanthis]MDV3170785.1 50S ribosomal protein L31 [Candidatus Phytoplasma stylosanthis]MDV3173824.1 50S ribosomal protein L31 [Candidatus Phytoplasma stylosanthis]MDV3174201.1 50S ribosomal protein L31 [Candidatus Phytoplasma stylosanthis]MDV3202726.1 50S ribosomal protein L31 [Candidatus Phytoplasma stylosanthis]
MKKKIKQPEFYQIEVSCVTCGEKHKIGTTAKKIKVEICSNCHSFYTGKQSFVTVAGQIDKFRKRYEKKDKKNDIKEIPIL